MNVIDFVALYAARMILKDDRIPVIFVIVGSKMYVYSIAILSHMPITNVTDRKRFGIV